MTSTGEAVSKFDPAKLCPKCGGNKISNKFDFEPEQEDERRRRARIKWPVDGELIASICLICGFVWVSRPLDFQQE